ncbi:hypothetical protein L598_001400000860 [Mesorhizobium sp. J18]|uniref:hypothetical protein n=1 Tax=Mesorhizobium sp. J18 TaxID=935263 RepID=UPI001199B21E|nr:hypothetical protein [Mesorhizobium sp. J18]TWG99548.1 hypothetical protein L598_001400000860 [Mesorhizobium sp. J18]
MEATSTGVPSPLPQEAQPPQAQITVEQQLFDYLLEVEKGVGANGQFTDPSAFIGTTLQTVDGIAQQAREAFEKANTGFSPGSDGASANGGLQSAQTGAEDAAGTQASEGNLAFSLDRAVEVMWASANVSMAVNGMTAATSSANTLIQQQ